MLYGLRKHRGIRASLPHKDFTDTGGKSGGIYESLEAFAEMAKKDFQKAYLFFIKFDFEKMLKKSAPEYVTLYEGIRRISVSYRSMEEFLVACKKKEPISIRIRESRAKFEELEDSVKESIVIVKNQWGFQRLDISADAEFIRLERNVVTTDEFIGNYYQLDYIIEEEKLHAGKNYASIRIRTGSQELRYEIFVTKKGTKARKRTVLETQRQIERLISLYIRLQTRQIPVEEWQMESQKALRRYQEFGGKNPILTRDLVCFISHLENFWKRAISWKEWREENAA